MPLGFHHARICFQHQISLNADALSHLAPVPVDSFWAVTATTHQFSDVAAVQLTDNIINGCLGSGCTSQGQKKNEQPLTHYK